MEMSFSPDDHTTCQNAEGAESAESADSDTEIHDNYKPGGTTPKDNEIKGSDKDNDKNGSPLKDNKINDSDNIGTLPKDNEIQNSDNSSTSHKDNGIHDDGNKGTLPKDNDNICTCTLRKDNDNICTCTLPKDNDNSLPKDYAIKDSDNHENVEVEKSATKDKLEIVQIFADRKVGCPDPQHQGQRETEILSGEVSVVDEDDVLTKVVKKQEAALKRLEEIHGPGYGKPTPGSKCEARAVKYQASCVREIVELCGIISERGFCDTEGRKAIMFKDLFDSYRFISDKCCGLLLRARRYKLINFQGEMLFQGRDDRTVITMVRTFQEIHGYFKKHKQVIPPGAVYVAPTKVRKKIAKKLSRGSSFKRRDNKLE